MKIAMFGVKGMPYPGGIELTCENLGYGLVKKGHEVIVYIRPYYTQKFQKEYKGMKLVLTKGFHSKHLDAITHTATATIHALFSGVDIFYYHSTGISIFSILPRLIGKKSIVHIHGLDWIRKKWGLFAKLFLKATGYSTAYFPNLTFAVSKDNAEYFKKKFGKPAIYMPNGVSVNEKATPKEILKYGLAKDNYILFASRLVPEKGCHYLIDAFEKISTDKKLVIAGDTSIHDDYYHSIRKKQNNRIIFTGFVTGRLLDELYCNSYFFVQPSEIEGLPHSILQAMNYGKCVLASDIPGNIEALGECGLLFKSMDRKDLQEKLEYLLNNPEFLKTQRKKAVEHVSKNYDWNKIVDKLESKLETLRSRGDNRSEGTN